ncbi:MAG: hypothetical protein JHD02_03545 [Thermoleophilaceae bacterium]|nr:hypothetical protein [Thermoleophilaceae bacterium]
MSRFKSKKELRLVMDQVIATLGDDTEVGPRLRALGTPVEITYTDFDLTVNIRGGEDGESNLVWVWSKRVKWEPATRIEVTSDVANQFMQGKLQVAKALALRKAKVKGSLTAGLRIVAVCGPAFRHYRDRVENDFPHLVV